MKLRTHIFSVIFTVITFLISGCNFTLAEDVTPPPGYVPPTPVPTLVLVPPQTPNVENGKAIFGVKCAGCHGATGLGDGEQGIQLGVTVPAFGLPEIARPAAPAQWYTIVTRGNLERLMPPFNSLNDQERWDVVAFAMSLHTTEDQIATGREIFESRCANCSTDFFTNAAKMSAISEVDLARIVKQGNDSVPAFGADLRDDEMWAVAAYLRTLSFDMAPAVAEAPASTATQDVAPVTEAPITAETTPVGTEQAAARNEPTIITKEGFGSVSGTIDNQSGTDLPSDLQITLRSYEHGADPNAGPQEVFATEGTVNTDGTYRFDNIEMPENRIFISEVEVQGIKLKSGYGIVEAGITSLTLPPLTIYGMTSDTSALVMDEVRLFLDYSGSNVQVFSVYSFRNPGNKTILVELKDGTEIPFIKSPEGTTSQGYEALQDSQPFVSTDKGLAIPPSENSYGLISFTSVPRQEAFEVAQSFELPVSSLTLFLPEGVKAENDMLTDEGLQTIQNFNFQVYTTLNIPSGTTIKFTVSGEPQESSTASVESTTNSNRNLLIGAGVLGLAFIAAGAWLYLRGRNPSEEDEEEEENDFKSSEEVLDAIVALDDLYRDKKISDDAYQKRRAELKEILKGMIQ